MRPIAHGVRCYCQPNMYPEAPTGAVGLVGLLRPFSSATAAAEGHPIPRPREVNPNGQLISTVKAQTPPRARS